MLEISIGLEWVVLARYFKMARKPFDFINYSLESGGPPEAGRIIEGDDGWRNPKEATE